MAGLRTRPAILKRLLISNFGVQAIADLAQTTALCAATEIRGILGRFSGKALYRQNMGCRRLLE